jgi:hypothetical protein
MAAQKIAIGYQPFKRTAYFFESILLKDSVDQFSQNLYTPIRIQQGGGADIFLRSERKSLESEGNFREI